jgi:hypothetical protein
LPRAQGRRIPAKPGKPFLARFATKQGMTRYDAINYISNGIIKGGEDTQFS